MHAASHATVAEVGKAYSETKTETGAAGLTYVGCGGERVDYRCSGSAGPTATKPI